MGIHPTSIRGAQAVHGLNNQAIFPTIVRSGRTDVVHPGDVAMGDSTGQADFAAETIEDAGQADDLSSQHFQRHDFA